MKIFAALLLALLACGPCCAGAWGAGSFDNDDALDWVRTCTSSKGATSIAATLQDAVGASALEAPEGAMMIAAAEVVAAARGRPSKTLPKEINAWLGRQPRSEIAKLAPLARNALATVRNPQVSELRQLWTGATEKEWLDALTDLDSRLR